MTTSKVPLLTLLCITLLSICIASNPESEKWLAENSKKEGVVTLPSGLQYKVLREGYGTHHPGISAPTDCHYEGKLINGEVFDSSYSRGEPANFAPNTVIKGWTEAMQLMVDGDKWELYLPSDLAYGDSGSPPMIQGGDALIFTLDMLEVIGEKVPAIKCSVVTFEDCSEREKAYVQKVRANAKFTTEGAIQTEIERIQRVSENVSDSAKSWANMRVRLLKSIMEIGLFEEL